MAQQTVQPEELPDLSPEDRAALINFAADMNSVLGKLKQADDTGTNALLLNHEVGALLAYLKAASEQWRAMMP